jgi:hypothetical protein
MPRGGKRPGAGAPKGNLNAFKHGRRSPRARRIIETILADPAARRALIELQRSATEPALGRKRRQTRIDELRAALDPAVALRTLRKRDQRRVRALRRMRAILTARLERDERRASSWRTLLAEETARLALPSPLDGEGPGVSSRTVNQPEIQNSKREQSRFNEVFDDDMIDHEDGFISVLDDPLLWSETS